MEGEEPRGERRIESVGEETGQWQASECCEFSRCREFLVRGVVVRRLGDVEGMERGERSW